MSKSKKIACWIHRWSGSAYGNIGNADWNMGTRTWDELRKIFPMFTVGLRPGQTRKLVLIQTKRGIKLERARP